MISTQVLIIGAGPVGVVSALSLSQAGIQCVLVEKRLERLDAPKAHAVNARTLEICDRLGVSANEITAAGASIEDGGQVHFMDTLTGTRFGSLPYERQDDGARAFTPWPLINIPQPTFEGLLSKRLAHSDHVSLLRGVAVERVDQSPDSVLATLSGPGLHGSVEVRADYVIAADGAGSATREALSIGMAGPEALAHYMMIHFEADLRPLTEPHPGLLYFCMNPAASGVFIGYERERTWVFMQSYDPSKETREDFDDATCIDLVQAAAGAAIAPIRIRNVSPWTMTAQVADRYRSDRVFLAGDAAHRFPPTGGLGLNTGVADAQNLSWKLSRVLKGDADPSLLDSYESERKPVAEINSQQSVANSAQIMHVFAALYGADPTETEAHYARACTDPANHPGLADAVELQRPHFDSFNLQLGYAYGVPVDVAGMDISRYEPSFAEGHHLPLIKLTDGPWLLGLLPHTDFALVTGPHGQAWPSAGVRTFVEGEDFVPTEPFHTRAGLEPDGALLIRPDGHIAARWRSAPEDLQSAVASALT